MYEILYYTGLAAVIICFIITLVLFFTLRIPSVIKYFIKSNNRKVSYRSKNNKKQSYKKPVKTIETDEKTWLLEEDEGGTSILESDSTSVMTQFRLK